MRRWATRYIDERLGVQSAGVDVQSAGVDVQSAGPDMQSTEPDMQSAGPELAEDQTALRLTQAEKLWFVMGALKSTLLIGCIYMAAGGIIIWLMLHFWS